MSLTEISRRAGLPLATRALLTADERAAGDTMMICGLPVARPPPGP
jgi:hypothetical protein